jgi:hypothetical protein
MWRILELISAGHPFTAGVLAALDIGADAAHAPAITGQKSWAPVAERPVALPPASTEHDIWSTYPVYRWLQSASV